MCFVLGVAKCEATNRKCVDFYTSVCGLLFSGVALG